MSSILKSLTILVSVFTTFAIASPIASRPSRPYMLKRSPLSDASFTDWPTNVIMLGGSQEFGMWIPTDGAWYDLSTITCLDLPAYAEGACDSPTIDQIGVVVGDGPCSFVGSNGYSTTIEGISGEGYYTVGPPQTIIMAACG